MWGDSTEGEVAESGVGIPGFKFCLFFINLTWSFMFKSSQCHAAACCNQQSGYSGFYPLYLC